MTVREYLEMVGLTNKRNTQLTFVKGFAKKWDNAPGYDMAYQTTSVRCIWEWLNNDSPILDYIMINEEQPPLSRVWNNWYNKCGLKCFMVIPMDELKMIYSEKQALEMVEFWGKEIKERMKK